MKAFLDTELSPKQKNRFWARVHKSQSCWLWILGKDKDGYGLVSFNGAQFKAHRISWMLTYGDPLDLHVLHKCDNPSCVNPNHLFLGTAKDNVTDCISKGRKTYGELHSSTKVSDADLIIIKYKMSLGIPATIIGKEFGLGQSQILRIYNGKSRRQVT